MAKVKRRKGREVKGHRPPPPPAAKRNGKSGLPAPALPIVPPGQRFYDLPYSAAAPRLINPDLGLHNLVARAGHNAAYTIDVTLLDAPDHRLIRSGGSTAAASGTSPRPTGSRCCPRTGLS